MALLTIKNSTKIDPEFITKFTLHTKPTYPVLRAKVTLEQMQNILTGTYRAEVERRHRKYVEDEQTKSNILRVAEFLCSNTGRCGLMINGQCGNGKSTMIKAVQSAFNILNSASTNTPLTIPPIYLRVTPAYKLTSPDYTHADLNNDKGARLLALEDLGNDSVCVNNYGNKTNPIHDLIEHRYDNFLFTFITTNLTNKSILERYGERINDRLNEMCEIIHFGNSSYRQ